MCGEDRRFTLIRLTREIKYLRPQRERGKKGNGEGGGTLRWSESGLKLTDPLTMTSGRKAQHVKTNNMDLYGGQ